MTATTRRLSPAKRAAIVADFRALAAERFLEAGHMIESARLHRATGRDPRRCAALARVLTRQGRAALADAATYATR